MFFIDSHTHLYDEAFSEDLEETIARAVEAGVTKLVFPDVDSTEREKMFSIAGRYPGTVFPCLGLHPTSVNASWEEEYEKMMDWSGKKIYAIGEIGMDLYWSKEFINEQKEAFRRQIVLACSKNLPVIIHAREATEPIVEILEENRHLPLRGVFHAYSGSWETFERVSRTGDWYAGIGGVLTFKKASIAETIKKIPLERILLETDSPYLTPAPYRGKRNESSYIPIIAAKVAQQKGTDIEEVAETTTRNAETLFGI